jgi:hypothetical protein
VSWTALETGQACKQADFGTGLFASEAPGSHCLPLSVLRSASRFPTSLAIDKPFVMDKLSLLASHYKEPGSRRSWQLQYPRNIPRASPPHFGMIFGSEFWHLEPGGKDALDGFGNLKIGAKYQFLTNATHEAIASIGLEAEVGGTGDLPEPVQYISVAGGDGHLKRRLPDCRPDYRATHSRDRRDRERCTGALRLSIVCGAGLKAPFSELTSSPWVAGPHRCDPAP